MNFFDYINSLSLFGSEKGYKPGLNRIRRLLHYLSDPQQNLKFIHIAGTNGKGSTAAILERIYREAGFKTALYSSPHFFHFNERIKINGKAASTSNLSQIITEIKEAERRMAAENYSKASFFEIITAAAFKYFQIHEAEIVILETGLGGRLDATNIIEKPLLSIITNINLEHSQLLGENTAKIAAEKAGIIKKDSITLSSTTDQAALNVIKEKALKLNNKFINLNEEYDQIKSCGSFKKNIISLSRGKLDKNYQISLLGKHQAVNTALALRAVEELNNIFPVQEAQIKKALKKVYLAGRMEKILDKPITIIDAAHNPAAFNKLLDNISEYSREYEKIHFVFSLLKDKNIAKILEEFSKFDIKAEFYLAENRSFRTIQISELENEIRKQEFSYKLFDTVAEAARAALKNAAETDLIAAAGSFNTIFETKIEFLSDREG